MKKNNRKRNKAVTIRMTQSEYDAIKDLVDKSGVTFQSYIINSALDAKITTKDEIDAIRDKDKAFFDLIRQLRGMSTNINQLAHRVNQGGMLPTMNELYDISNQINDFRHECEKEWNVSKLNNKDVLIAASNLSRKSKKVVVDNGNN